VEFRWEESLCNNIKIRFKIYFQTFLCVTQESFEFGGRKGLWNWVNTFGSNISINHKKFEQEYLDYE